MKVVLSERAGAYLRNEHAYVAKFNIRAAVAIVRQIRIALRTIGEYPQAGAVLPAAIVVRRFVTPPYQIDYVIRDDAVFVVAIRHGRQAAIEPDVDEDDFDV